MKEMIEEFEKRAIDAVSELRNLLGAKRINVSVHDVDNYEAGCEIEVAFFTSRPVPGCVRACKDD